MKTIDEIKNKISILETALADAKSWANKAHDRYRADKKEWGEADYGETGAAYEVVNELESQIMALNWVLE
jgi:hypothetical protein